MRAATLLAVLAATPAAALTCAPPDILRSYAAAEAAPEPYVVLRGRLDFDPAAMPRSGYAGDEPGALQDPPPVPARFHGESLTPAGWERSGVRAVTLQPTCAGPWCGSIAPGGSWLLLAREAGEDLVVEVGPCGGWAFADPPEGTAEALAACRAGGPCAP